MCIRKGESAILYLFSSGKQALNPEHEAQGAINAAYQYNRLSKLQVTGYRFLDDVTLSASQQLLFNTEPELRLKMNVLDDAEVQTLLLNKICSMRGNVQIIFNHYKCTRCGCEGDKRLLPQYCHMDKHFIHPGSYQLQHAQGICYLLSPLHSFISI